MYVDSIIISGGQLIAGKCLLSDLVKHSFHSGLLGIPFNGNIEIILTNTGPNTIALPLSIPQVRPRKIIDMRVELSFRGWPALVTSALRLVMGRKT